MKKAILATLLIAGIEALVELGVAVAKKKLGIVEEPEVQYVLIPAHVLAAQTKEEDE